MRLSWFVAGAVTSSIIHRIAWAREGDNVNITLMESYYY